MARGFAKLHTLGSPCGRRHPGSSVPRVAIASPRALPCAATCSPCRHRSTWSEMLPSS